MLSAEAKRENSKKGRREEERIYVCEIRTNLHKTNRTRVCAIFCANLKMFYSQKRTKRTNRTNSHKANKTTMSTGSRRTIAHQTANGQSLVGMLRAA